MTGLLVIELFADHLHSLKEKRQILSSLKDRLHHKFNAAAAETGHLDSWQKAQLSIVSVSSSRQVLESMFQQVEKMIDETCEMRITSLHVDYS